MRKKPSPFTAGIHHIPGKEKLREFKLRHLPEKQKLRVNKTNYKAVNSSGKMNYTEDGKVEASESP